MSDELDDHIKRVRADFDAETESKPIDQWFGEAEQEEVKFKAALAQFRADVLNIPVLVHRGQTTTGPVVSTSVSDWTFRLPLQESVEATYKGNAATSDL